MDETWTSKAMNELNQKPKSEWTESDWETYHYIKQIEFERGYHEE